ncbi:trifunctional serine/threonine-protein kinase/ATP-binding protein/sensor histidine kinase [Paraburkholderia sabiae]|uniref:trifunctional serine/threonine-protein kinase/ATP-binding protein/sensor histidine kinase n=1 Tax=Paraburkholderia sabiae TaxID=273251 RepID=UPI001CC609B2|nr:ATP-binding sensor histidine kinase [Paraburkholderia sabiae]
MLEPLREGADCMLYRGIDPVSQLPILALSVAAEQLSPQSLRRLEHECSLADELDPAWAAQPLALVRQQARVLLILRDPGGEPLDQVIKRHKGHPLNLPRFLRIAIGLTSALCYAHQKGLIHKDVKPANALVDGDGHAWLTGFGIASRLPRERQSPEAPEFIAGSLPYMAPEQTGRMNRSLDSRSDLYSLGVTLYEMSTGELPFAASDPMEWVHCQIARQPASPSERAPELPAPVASIIMKLLAKTAEERYQTAVGLERDLQRCQREWEQHGRIDPFPLGEHDRPDRLLIPEKLYGRAVEIDTLLASFDRVMHGGRPELVLVSGYSGVGKSSLVYELHKPLVPPRGFFASGKFDQYKRDIPYATLAQAFQSLIRPILAKDEAELARWRDAIHEALGPNGQLMIDLVPELKLIIGEQPPVPELPQQDAQSRFQLVFRRFIGVFTREHPLALFLDDLQWLDAATLDLMADLLTHPDVNHLLLIGAYRDNEVVPTHPLTRKLEAIRESGAAVHDIVLAPLTRHDLEELIEDSLLCERARAEPLAELIAEKTAGNPFFAIQFLSGLAEESLLAFDYGKGQWSWDLNRIHARRYTDNVVDLMVGKLHRLPVDTQNALQQLACLGNSADFAMLRMVYQESADAMHGQLWEAVRSGLVYRSDDAYSFLHDRVQEAAYSLIPRELRAQTHLRIGMLMAANTAGDKLDEGIFEIVNQLNRGAHLIASVEERERVAGLNLIAGRRAKASTAYASALKYLHAGRELLTDETWTRRCDLIFAIEHLQAACEMLTADTAAAESRLSMLAERATSAHDIALVTCLRLMLYNLLGRSDRGVEVFIEYRRGHGEAWSPRPTDADVSREYERIWSLMQGRTIAQLVDLPLIADPDVLDVLDVFTEAVISAMITDENLLALVLCRMVSISLAHGNSDASCFAYVSLGMLAGPHFGNYEAGFQLGKLGYDLVEKHGLHRYQARVYLRFGNCITPWRRHVRTGRELVQRAFDAANDIGDLTFAAYSCHHLYTNRLATGDPLADVQRGAEIGLEFAEKARFGRVIDLIATQLALVRTLRGLTTTFGSLNDGFIDEPQFEEQLSRDPILALPECWYWTRKLQARYFAGDYACAIDASRHAARLLWTSHSFFEVAEYHFYCALARAAAYDSAKEDERQEHVEALARHERQLAIWAESCADNFENRAALVGAEIARIEGRILDAEQLYEKAIRSAHANGFVHNEAVANEVAARFYAARGFDKIARTYLRDARYGYLSWGADGKVRQLDQLYPHIKDEQPDPGSTSTFVAPNELLDLATVIKISQVLSSEIVLPRLIETLIRIAVENAGAERGLLILLRGGARGGEPRIEAEATSGAGRIDVAVWQAAVTPSDLPLSALHYVMRTRKLVLLDDARADDVYAADEYVQRKRSRSVLCLPIVRQAELVGALYLENNLAPCVFTSDRVALLQLLASQAAISLDNAALYTDLQRSEHRYRQLFSETPVGLWQTEAQVLVAMLADLRQQGVQDLSQYIDAHPEWLSDAYDGLVLEDVNNHAMQMFGARDRRDLLGPLSWVWRANPGTFRRAVTSRYNGEELFQETTKLPTLDGRIIDVLFTVARPRKNDDQGIAVISLVDLTERVRAQEMLQRVQADFAHAARISMLGELAASIAHELKQPLAAINMSGQAVLRWLNRPVPNLDEARATSERIMIDAQRAVNIIQRIRGMAVRDAPEHTLVSLAELIDEALGFLGHELQSQSIAVTRDYAAGAQHVFADRVQLQQVIVNLTVNAMQAMTQARCERREITIRVDMQDAGTLCCAVEDSGPGIAPEHLDSLFESFFTTKENGMGMGLPICRSIIEAHGGRISADNRSVHGGARFGLTLPMASGIR